MFPHVLYVVQNRTQTSETPPLAKRTTILPEAGLRIPLPFSQVLKLLNFPYLYSIKIHPIMASVTLGGNPLNTSGELPTKGSKAPDFTLAQTDLKRTSLSDFAGSRLILNIFPSVDTGTCAASVRQFNQLASGLDNTKVLCISRDLPFAQKRFCGAEGLDNVISLSDFETADFGKDYGVLLLDGGMKGLLSRSIVVLNENGEVLHTELVPDIKDEPDYDAALAAL
jgi:thioredoxin-dependent peroxiredoxin